MRSNELISKALAEEKEEPRLRGVNWRGRYVGYGWGGSLKPIRTATGATVHTRQAGEGIAHRISLKGKPIGHISGFVRNMKGEDNHLHVHATELSSEEHRGQGHWQAALQELAQRYPGGVHFTKFDTMTPAQKGLRKIPGVIETDERFIIPGRSAK